MLCAFYNFIINLLVSIDCLIKSCMSDTNSGVTGPAKQYNIFC